MAAWLECPIKPQASQPPHQIDVSGPRYVIACQYCNNMYSKLSITLSLQTKNKTQIILKKITRYKWSPT